MVMGVILFMGKISGAHLNPAVSIAFALRRDFPWQRVPGYIVVQLAGAALAAWFLQAVINVSAIYGSNYPAPDYSNFSAFLMETVLTFGLVSVILGTASGAQNVGVIGALGVGGYIALAGLWGSPISGASMNPARTFGPDLISADFGAYWVYVAGPIAGAVIAVGAAFVLRGRAAAGPDPRPPRVACSPRWSIRRAADRTPGGQDDLGPMARSPGSAPRDILGPRTVRFADHADQAPGRCGWAGSASSPTWTGSSTAARSRYRARRTSSTDCGHTTSRSCS